jgi:hypothetical protein
MINRRVFATPSTPGHRPIDGLSKSPQVSTFGQSQIDSVLVGGAPPPCRMRPGFRSLISQLLQRLPAGCHPALALPRTEFVVPTVHHVLCTGQHKPWRMGRPSIAIGRIELREPSDGQQSD